MSSTDTAAPELSVIIPLRDASDFPTFPDLFCDYNRELQATGLRYEFILVFEGKDPGEIEALDRLRNTHASLTFLQLASSYGEATALSAGAEQAAGALLLTLPSRRQVEPEALPALIDSLEDRDMVVVRRWPRTDGWLNRLQTRAFHFILRLMLKHFRFHDLGCSVRLFRKHVIERVHVYGDQQRFFPILAGRYGYKVKEIELPQSPEDAYQEHYAFGVYLRRLLDLLTIFFLVKFTEKPLRFFGLTGFAIFLAGAVFTGFLAAQRLFMGVALADRPVLLLGLLLIVLGVQLFAFGLLGELIIFTHSKDLKTYTVEKVVN